MMFRLWLILLTLIQMTFGTYYAWTEYQRAQHFNPLLTPSEFRKTVVDPAAHADIPAGDIEAYLKSAHSIATRGNLTLESGLPSAWVTPGYPFALAIFFKIFGFSYWSVLLLNGISWAIAYVFVKKINQILKLSKSESVLSLFIFAANLRLSMFVGYVYTECLFVAFITVFAALFLKAITETREPNLKSALLLGLTAGTGALIRPVLLVPAAVLSIVGMFYRSSGSAMRSTRYTKWALVIVLALIPLSLWVLRNSRSINYAVVSTNSALAQAEGRQDFYLEKSIFGIFPAAQVVRPYGSIASGEYDTHPELNLFFAARKWTTSWDDRHGYREKAHLLGQRLLALASPFIEAMSPRNKLMSLFYWLLIFPAAIASLFLKRTSAQFRFLASFAFLLIFLPALVVVGPSLRYQIPGQVLLSPLAAVGIISITKSFGSLLKKRTAGAT